jgi:hypothetical protein
MALISSPGISSVDAQGKDGLLLGVTSGWRNFFNSVFNICNALTMSGATANRPTAMLWPGRTYFDTTLGKPIWFKTAGWVDATGAPA